MGSLALRPGNSLTVPRTALSISFTSFVSSTGVTQATGLLTLAPAGLTPTEHASLRWTHSYPKTRPTSIQIAYAEGSPLLQVLKRLAQIEIFHD
jgi:hypothetical protein